MIEYTDFERVELRVGTVVRAEPFPEARKPALKLWIDFGEIGVRTSSAQLTLLYTPEALIGTQVIAVTNFAPRRIAGFESQVLVTGFELEPGQVTLARPDHEAPNGARLF